VLLFQATTAFAFRHYRNSRVLEDFLAATQHFIQCFLKVGGAFRELLPYLRNILFEALFYLLSKELFQSPVTQALRVFRRVVSDDVGNEGTRETLGALVGVLGQERIQGPASAGVCAC
jgi:hypothetical protein